MISSSLKASIRANSRKVAWFIRRPMRFPSYSREVSSYIETLGDDVRYASLALAIQRIEIDHIDGAFAELGVHKGITSRFIHKQAPHRHLYLFDTFEGFPAEALEAAGDMRFKDTSMEDVARLIGDTTNVIFRQGFFPDTGAGLEQEHFALVMLDFDLYQSALDAFKFFYPRMVPGGYFFMHDFNSPESNHAISRAMYEYMSDKPEMIVEIPDEWGSAVFRKLAPSRS